MNTKRVRLPVLPAEVIYEKDSEPDDNGRA